MDRARALKQKRKILFNEIPRLIQDMGFEIQHWIDSCCKLNKLYRAIGSSDKLKQLAEKMAQKSLHGLEVSRQLWLEEHNNKS